MKLLKLVDVTLILVGSFLVGKAFASWDLMFGVAALYLATWRE